MAKAIDTLLLEERRYPPAPGFSAQANAQPGIYDVRSTAPGKAMNGEPFHEW